MKSLFLLCLSVLSVSLPLQSHALSSDRQQAINIQADSAMVDDKLGVTIYSGNVIIDQGTLRITADEVKVLRSNREVLQIIASMAPESKKRAHYEQLPDGNEELVSADARIITYFLAEERLHLVGNAFLKQTRDTFSGEILHYDVSSGIVDLKGGSKSNPRIKITIAPNPE